VTARREIRDLAGAMRRASRREAVRHGTGRYEGVVLDPDPLRVDVLGQDVELTDDDITIGNALAAHLVAEGPLETDDVLVLVETETGDYDAVDVLRDA
jgi:hypothetical protein